MRNYNSDDKHTVNTRNANISDQHSRKYIVIPYIKNTSEGIAFLFKKSTLTVEYRSINELTLNDIKRH